MVGSVEIKAVPFGSVGGDKARSGQITKGRVHSRDSVPRVALQRGSCSKKEPQVVSGLYKFE